MTGKTDKIKDVKMADSTITIKVSQHNYDRLIRYGCAGESINTALERVLDIAAKHPNEFHRK